MSEKIREKAAHWFENTLYSRLNDKRSGAILVVTQRLYTKDLCSFLLNRYQNWTHLKIPFIAEETSIINFGEFQHYRKKVIFYILLETIILLSMKCAKELGYMHFLRNINKSQ